MRATCGVVFGASGTCFGQDVRLECAAITSGGFVDAESGAVFVLGQALVGVAEEGGGGGVRVEAGIVYCFGGVGGCAADWDGDGGVNSNDFFTFLESYFGGGADFDGDGVTNSDDFFAFLTAYFAGC